MKHNDEEGREPEWGEPGFVVDPDPQKVHIRTTIEREGERIIERTWLCTNAVTLAHIGGTATQPD